MRETWWVMQHKLISQSSLLFSSRLINSGWANAYIYIWIYIYTHSNKYTHWGDSIPIHECKHAVLEVVWEQGPNAASSIQHRSSFTTSPAAWHPTGTAVDSERPLAHTWVRRTANQAAGTEPVARGIALICLLPFLSFKAGSSLPHTQTYTAALAEMPDTVRAQKPLDSKAQQLFALACCPIVPTWGPRYKKTLLCPLTLFHGNCSFRIVCMSKTELPTQDTLFMVVCLWQNL